MPVTAQDLLPELDYEAAATRRILERVPADRLGWKPHPKSMSLGQLALHLARLPATMTAMAAAGKLDVAGARFEAPSPEGVESVLSAFDESVAAARGYLEGLDEAGGNARWRLVAGDTELVVAPRIGMLRRLLFNHWYHHRGQLSVYLRLLDVAVPSVYGPSADENPFAAIPG